MTHVGSLQKLLNSAIISYNNDHPNWAIPQKRWSSLTKRMETIIKEYFNGILGDRIILDWLAEHRYEWTELSKIRGSLREVIPNEIIKRSQECNTTFSDKSIEL